MNLVQENDQNGDYHEELSVSPENSDICSGFGDSEVLPRVGEEYQVDVPPLVSKSDYVSISKIKFEREIRDIRMGLAIPVMWINEDDEIVKQKSLKFKNFPGDDLREKSSCMALRQETEVDMHRNMVPGSSSDSWKGMEEASILLSLYIFGKNLVQVKKFVESKSMGDVLSFYYGKFYRSEKYRRWSECRKMRGRRCIYGQRLFTGWRQHELLSRLFVNGFEERKNALLEVSKTFTEGKIRFDEYIFALKAIVGLKDLIEAVGIGKGKHDLTGFAMDPLKSNQIASIRPEIPSGKACSTLTLLEIVKFLTGNFRLSKARTSDLFWEAVWPRLLARGWHSEQPRDPGFSIGTKHALVFLIPGIENFSGRKLVKGNHYFDSVSDVLSKVASNPCLLELENGENGEENGWSHEINQPRHCYLQPRTPNHDSDSMNFTIVDTSLACGKNSKIRELRSLPIGIMRNSNDGSRSPSEEIYSVSSENSIDTVNLNENNGVKNRVRRRGRGLNPCNELKSTQKPKPEEATCSSENKSSSTSSIREHAQDMSRPRELIDLNLPISLDDEISESFPAEAVKPTQIDQNSRRQSTRNRPLTTKALEALALGFLDVKQKRKCKDRFPDENSTLRPSRRARASVRSSEERESSINNSNCELFQ